LTLKDILAPAITLAREGFVMNSRVTQRTWAEDSEKLVNEKNTYGKELLTGGITFDKRLKNINFACSFYAQFTVSGIIRY